MSQIVITLVILFIAAILLLRNILRPDVVALMLMLALGLTGILTTQEVFSGFSRSVFIIMLSAYVLAEGLRRSGMTERMGRSIIRLFGSSEKGLIFGVMASSAMLSLFMNNIAAASLLIPSLSGMARHSRVSPSKLLMPLAFGTILGGHGDLTHHHKHHCQWIAAGCRFVWFFAGIFRTRWSAINHCRHPLHDVLGIQTAA